MSLLKRLAYVGLGGLLVLALIVGAAVTFAQNGDEAETPEAQTEEDVEEFAPRGQWALRGFHGGPGNLGDFIGNEEAMAEALGISVDELQDAYEEARVAAVEQALDDGLLTEEQAEQLQEGTARFRGRFGPGHFLGAADHEALLAEALGISVEELQDARAEVSAARLEAMVEAGVLTQEEADLIAAREAVQTYVDREALSSAVQDAYEDAIQAAVDAGAITQEQADLLLENMPAFGEFGFGFHGGFGKRGGHHGFRGAPGAFFNSSALEAPADA